jgi:hypothetical protein
MHLARQKLGLHWRGRGACFKRALSAEHSRCTAFPYSSVWLVSNQAADGGSFGGWAYRDRKRENP